jgi:Holliday junction resolvasome RuvABC endonuclease subunit
LETKENGLILGLDVSTSCIGISLIEDKGTYGKLELLHHVTPIVKPKPASKMQELFEKAIIFESEFLDKYADVGITRVIIEEPLLRSNNVNTVATLLRFNGMISRAVYDTLGIVPEYISSYDARCYGFPELMAVRTINRKGEAYTEKEIAKKNPVLFGAYYDNVDKKSVVWELVADMEPQITWIYDKKGKLKKENFDMTDAYAAVIGHMRKEGFWK